MAVSQRVGTLDLAQKAETQKRVAKLREKRAALESRLENLRAQKRASPVSQVIDT